MSSTSMIYRITNETNASTTNGGCQRRNSLPRTRTSGHRNVHRKSAHYCVPFGSNSFINQTNNNCQTMFNATGLVNSASAVSLHYLSQYLTPDTLILPQKFLAQTWQNGTGLDCQMMSEMCQHHHHHHYHHYHHHQNLNQFHLEYHNELNSNTNAILTPGTTRSTANDKLEEIIRLFRTLQNNSNMLSLPIKSAAVNHRYSSPCKKLSERCCTSCNSDDCKHYFPNEENNESSLLKNGNSMASDQDQQHSRHLSQNNSLKTAGDENNKANDDNSNDDDDDYDRRSKSIGNVKILAINNNNQHSFQHLNNAEQCSELIGNVADQAMSKTGADDLWHNMDQNIDAKQDQLLKKNFMENKVNVEMNNNNNNKCNLNLTAKMETANSNKIVAKCKPQRTASLLMKPSAERQHQEVMKMNIDEKTSTKQINTLNNAKQNNNHSIQPNRLVTNLVAKFEEKNCSIANSPPSTTTSIRLSWSSYSPSLSASSSSSSLPLATNTTTTTSFSPLSQLKPIHYNNNNNFDKANSKQAGSLLSSPTTTISLASNDKHCQSNPNIATIATALNENENNVESNLNNKNNQTNKIKFRTKPKPPPKPASLMLLSSSPSSSSMTTSPTSSFSVSNISSTSLVATSPVLSSFTTGINNIVHNKLPPSQLIQFQPSRNQPNPNDELSSSPSSLIGGTDNRSDNKQHLTSIDAALIIKSTISSPIIAPTFECLTNNNNHDNVDNDQIEEKMSTRADLIIKDQFNKMNKEKNVDDADNDNADVDVVKANQADFKLNSTPLPLTDQQHRVNLNHNLNIGNKNNNNNNNNNNNPTKCQSYCCCCCCPNTGTCTGVANCNKLLGIDLAKIQPVPKPRKCSLFGKKSGDKLEIKSSTNPIQSDLALKDHLNSALTPTPPSTVKLIGKHKTIKCTNVDVVDSSALVNETNESNLEENSPVGSGDNSSSDEGIENPAVLDDDELDEDDDDDELRNKTKLALSVDNTNCHYYHHHRNFTPHSHHQHHFNHHNQLVNHYPESRKSPSLSFKSSRTVSPLFPNSTNLDDVHQVERFLNGTNTKHLNTLKQEESVLLKEIVELESEPAADINDTNEEIDEELLEFQRFEREIKLSELRRCLKIVQKQIQTYKAKFAEENEVEKDKMEKTAESSSDTKLDFDTMDTVTTNSSDLSLLNDQCQLDQTNQQTESENTSLNISKSSTLAPLAEPENDSVSKADSIEPDTTVNAELDLSDSDESDLDEVIMNKIEISRNTVNNADENLIKSLDDILHESIENKLEKVNDLTEQEQESFVANALKPEEARTLLVRRTSRYDNEQAHDCHMKHFGYQRNVDMLMLKSAYQKLDLDKYQTETNEQTNMLNASSISNEMLESTTSETDSIVLRRRSARFPASENDSNGSNLQSQDELSTHSDQPVLRKRNSAISNLSTVGGSGSQRPLTLYMPVPNQKINLITHLHALGHDLTSSIVTNHLLLTPCTCSGYLYKHCSSGVGKWRKRYFHFDRVRKVFVYYHDRSQFEKMRHPKRGVFFDEIQDVYVDHTRINMKKFLSNTNNEKQLPINNQQKYGSPGAMTNPIKPDGTRCVFVVSTAAFGRKFILSTYTPELMRIWMDVIFTGAQAYLQDFDDQMN